MPNGMKIRSLALLRETASTSRILNLIRVRERHSDDAEYSQKPLFQHSRLNQAIIIKHTLRTHERHLVNSEQLTATKIIFALDHNDLRLGGFSFFVEQHNLQDALQVALGVKVSDENYESDLNILREFARLPSLDPYLLRERVQQSGTDVAALYFDISDADLIRVESYVQDEICSLVALAYDIAGNEAKAISVKLAQLIMRNEQSSALEPLRRTLRLNPSDYKEGIFGWKGLLYYKWNISELKPKIKEILGRMSTTRFIRAHPEDEAQLNATRKAILRNVAMKFKEVQKTMVSYDEAFDALVNKKNPGTFRNFLLRAPALFNEIGQDLAAVNHICDFWEFRLPLAKPNQLEVDDAYDVYREFASALGGKYSFISL
jgi:hypothetical protein